MKKVRRTLNPFKFHKNDWINFLSFIFLVVHEEKYSHIMILLLLRHWAKIISDWTYGKQKAAFINLTFSCSLFFISPFPLLFPPWSVFPLSCTQHTHILYFQIAFLSASLYYNISRCHGLFVIFFLSYLTYFHTLSLVLAE